MSAAMVTADRVSGGRSVDALLEQTLSADAPRQSARPPYHDAALDADLYADLDEARASGQTDAAAHDRLDAIAFFARASVWVPLAQGVVFYAALGSVAIAILGIALFVVGVALSVPFPDLRALWAAPAVLAWGGGGCFAAMMVVSAALYMTRHAIEDARWAFGVGRVASRAD